MCYHILHILLIKSSITHKKELEFYKQIFPTITRKRKIHSCLKHDDAHIRCVVAIDIDACKTCCRRIAGVIASRSRRVAPCYAVSYRNVRRMRFMLIHYIKLLTVYQESALFLVMSRCFIRCLSICETASSSLACSASCSVLARLSCVLRNRNFVVLIVKSRHTRASRACVPMHHDRTPLERFVLLITRTGKSSFSIKRLCNNYVMQRVTLDRSLEQIS